MSIFPSVAVGTISSSSTTSTISTTSNNVIYSTPGGWSECIPRIWYYPDPNTGITILSNASPAPYTFPTPGSGVLFTLAPHSTVSIYPHAGVITLSSSYIPPGTYLPIFQAGPGLNGASVAPADTSDSLFPQDELVFSEKPLVLTEDNKAQIRAFCMEVPSIAKLVTKAKAFMKAVAEKARLKNDYKEQQASYKEFVARQAQSEMRRFVEQHEEQMKAMIDAQSKKLWKLKWISTFPGSRRFASD